MGTFCLRLLLILVIVILVSDLELQHDSAEARLRPDMVHGEELT